MKKTPLETVSLDSFSTGKIGPLTEEESLKLEEEVLRLEKKKAESDARWKKTVTIERVEQMFNDIFLDPVVPDSVKDRLHYHLATIRLAERVDSHNRVKPAHVGNAEKGKWNLEKVLKHFDNERAKSPAKSKSEIAGEIATATGQKKRTIENKLSLHRKD